MMPTAVSAATIEPDVGDETPDQFVHDPLAGAHFRKFLP